MWNAQRTIDAIAVLEWEILPMTIPILINIVALNAEPELSIALVSGLRAASHALPVDICVAMLLTVSLSGTNIFQ